MTQRGSWDELFAYDAWPSRANEPWGDAKRGDSPWDNLDFHVDLGCGKVPKARIGIDRYAAAGVAVITDLERLTTFSVPHAPGEDARPSLGMGASAGLPFSDGTVKSIVSHHCFEHIGNGFIPLVDEIYRVLEPGGLLRAITPLFPSWSAVSDPDHKRWFMAEPDGHSTWDAFCGTPEHHWCESFSVPYTRARFEKVDQDLTARSPDPQQWWTETDARELRVALRAVK